VLLVSLLLHSLCRAKGIANDEENPYRDTNCANTIAEARLSAMRQLSRSFQQLTVFVRFVASSFAALVCVFIFDVQNIFCTFVSSLHPVLHCLPKAQIFQLVRSRVVGRSIDRTNGSHLFSARDRANRGSALHWFFSFTSFRRDCAQCCYQMSGQGSFISPSLLTDQDSFHLARFVRDDHRSN
jgi:hypothetical protein